MPIPEETRPRPVSLRRIDKMTPPASIWVSNPKGTWFAPFIGWSQGRPLHGAIQKPLIRISESQDINVGTLHIDWEQVGSNLLKRFGVSDAFEAQSVMVVEQPMFKELAIRLGDWVKAHTHGRQFVEISGKEVKRSVTSLVATLNNDRTEIVRDTELLVTATSPRPAEILHGSQDLCYLLRLDGERIPNAKRTPESSPSRLTAARWHNGSWEHYLPMTALQYANNKAASVTEAILQDLGFDVRHPPKFAHALDKWLESKLQAGFADRELSSKDVDDWPALVIDARRLLGGVADLDAHAGPEDFANAFEAAVLSPDNYRAIAIKDALQTNGLNEESRSSEVHSAFKGMIVRDVSSRQISDESNASGSLIAQ